MTFKHLLATTALVGLFMAPAFAQDLDAMSSDELLALAQ